MRRKLPSAQDQIRPITTGKEPDMKKALKDEGEIMNKKCIIRWMYFGQVFIGIGIVFGLEYTGITIGNLFIGFEKVYK